MNFKEYLNMPIEIEAELLQNFPKDSNLVIFDIGSCEAEDTIKYSKLYPNSIIHSFEPIPGNFQKGVKNLEAYEIKNANLYQCALSNAAGEVDFFVSEGHPEHEAKTEEWDYGNKSSSLLPAQELATRYKWLNLDKTIKVQTITLSQFCKEHSIERIDFIHMDVQGAELMVLEGAEDFINKIGMIWLEAELVELYKGQPLKGAVIDFLTKNGFSIIKDTCNNVSGDILCINNKLWNK